MERPAVSEQTYQPDIEKANRQLQAMQATKMEIKRLKSLAQRYRVLVSRLILEGLEYTDDRDCPFCSGNDDYQSPATHSKLDTYRCSRRCPRRQAARLAAEKI